MQSGKLALLNSEVENLEDEVFEYTLPEKSPFDSVISSVRVDEVLSLNRGVKCIVGRAAQEDVERTESEEIESDGQISENKTAQKITRTTQFLLVPDVFLLVGSSSGEFLFPLLNEETNHSAYPAEISVDGFASDHDSAEYWKVGFTGRGDGAENGVVHGDTVFSDSEIGDVVGSADKNQLGVNFEYNGELLKLFVTESGYIDLYGTQESAEFAEFMMDVIMPYTRMQ